MDVSVYLAKKSHLAFLCYVTHCLRIVILDLLEQGGGQGYYCDNKWMLLSLFSILVNLKLP